MKTKITLFASLLLALSFQTKAADITIDPTASLITTYAGAASGDVIILGDGIYDVSLTLSLTKAITFKAQNSLQATVKGCQFIFNTNSIGNVKFEGIVFDGTKTDASLGAYFNDFNGATIFNNILVENCVIKNYGNCVLRANRAQSTCESYKINNSILKNFSSVSIYPLFQFTTTKITALELTNSTVSDIVCEFFQMYGTVGGNDAGTVLFKNNTFYNVVTSTARTPFGGKSGKFYLQNCILSTSPVHGTKELNFDATVTVKEATNNVMYSFAGGALATATAWSLISGTIDTDPGFKNAAIGDFTLPNGSALITNTIGDPRWFATVSSVVTPKTSNIAISYANNTLNLSEITNVKLFSLSGQLVKTAELTNSVSVSDISKGIYIAKAGSESKGYSIQKFIIK